MSPPIIEAEQKLNDLLHEQRLEDSPPAPLLAAVKLWPEEVVARYNSVKTVHINCCLDIW